MSDKRLGDRRTSPRLPGHRWIMIACIPLLLTVGVLAAAGATGGVAGAVGATFALICVGMMVGMMVIMTSEHRR